MTSHRPSDVFSRSSRWRPENVLATSQIYLPGTSLGRQIRKSPGLYFEISQGSLGDVGGGRLGDQCFLAGLLTKRLWSWLLTFLVIARADLSYWILSLSLRTSSATFVSENSILFCILSIIAINSCLMSLLRDSSVKDAMYLNNKNKLTK